MHYSQEHPSLATTAYEPFYSVKSEEKPAFNVSMRLGWISDDGRFHGIDKTVARTKDPLFHHVYYTLNPHDHLGRNIALQYKIENCPTKHALIDWKISNISQRTIVNANSTQVFLVYTDNAHRHHTLSYSLVGEPDPGQQRSKPAQIIVEITPAQETTTREVRVKQEKVKQEPRSSTPLVASLRSSLANTSGKTAGFRITETTPTKMDFPAFVYEYYDDMTQTLTLEYSFAKSPPKPPPDMALAFKPEQIRFIDLT